MLRSLLFGLGLTASLASAVRAQQPGAALPVVDTIIVITDNWISSEEIRLNPSLRVANALRFRTREYVVRRELLVEPGEPLNVLALAETLRNLRARGLFADVQPDTTTLADGRFALVIRTRDAWSTQLQLNGRVTGGTFTWAVGLTETNFLGSGDLASVSYTRGVDRNTVTLGGRMNRVLGSRLLAEGAYQNFSDGTNVVWRVGVPFKSMTEKYSFEAFGEAGDRQVLQFQTRSLVDADTNRFWRRVNRGGVLAQFAPIATGAQYVRLGTAIQLRDEEYIRVADTGMAVDDSVSALIEVFMDVRQANFHVVNYYNGFGVDEDLDLSTVFRLTGRAALEVLGYENTGAGLGIFVGSGVSFPSGYVRGSFNAHGLFNAGGLDSGRVGIRGTIGVKPGVRHATFLHASAGLRINTPPGHEFDLGHGVGPRTFGPHAFTGTRMVWGTFEHRWFVWDELLSSLGLGVAAFVDYGGAWYANQSRRFGGNVGLGLRYGFNRAAGPNIGRFDVGYRFGEGFGERLSVSVGRGFSF